MEELTENYKVKFEKQSGPLAVRKREENIISCQVII